MTLQAQLAMLSWIPILIYIFNKFPARKAVVIGFISAWLFLPQRTTFAFPGIPDYTRASATGYGILLAAFLFDVDRLRSFKLNWFDLPMLVWCLCPVASSLTNALGLYDGLATALSQFVLWGIPYFLGRVYLGDLLGMRLLATGIFLGGLVYAPLCLYEVRMSPQLHNIFYGFFPHNFGQTVRYGGWRPQVFMQHGLAVGLWMMAALLVGLWLWRANVISHVWGISMNWLLTGLIVTFVLIKSTGAWLLLILGVIVLFTTKWLRSAVSLYLLIAGIILFLYLNVSGDFNGDRVTSFLGRYLPQDRVASVEHRFNNEELLGDKARERIIFGWGGWGRSRIYEEGWDGKLVDVAATDSLWIIAFGSNGIAGLLGITASLLLPTVTFAACYPPKTWFNPKVAPAAVLAVLLVLYMVDNLLNNMPNPTYILITGGLMELVSKSKEVNVRRNLFHVRRKYNNFI